MGSFLGCGLKRGLIFFGMGHITVYFTLTEMIQ